MTGESSLTMMDVRGWSIVSTEQTLESGVGVPEMR